MKQQRQLIASLLPPVPNFPTNSSSNPAPFPEQGLFRNSLRSGPCTSLGAGCRAAGSASVTAASLLLRPVCHAGFRPVGMPGLHSYFINHPPSLTLLFVPFPRNTHRHTSGSVAHSAPGSAAGAGPTQAQQATDTPPGLFSPRAPVSPPPQPPLLRRSFPPGHRRQQPPRLQPRQGWRKLTLWEGAAGSRLKDLL